jgi:hypothetical protein
MPIPRNNHMVMNGDAKQLAYQLAQANEQTEQPVDSHNESSMEA